MNKKILFVVILMMPLLIAFPVLAQSADPTDQIMGFLKRLLGDDPGAIAINSVLAVLAIRTVPEVIRILKTSGASSQQLNSDLVKVITTNVDELSAGIRSLVGSIEDMLEYVRERDAKLEARLVIMEKQQSRTIEIAEKIFKEVSKKPPI